MAYSDVATAVNTAAMVQRVALALEKQAALRIDVVGNDPNADQRELTLCRRIYSDSGVPMPYTDMVLIAIDLPSVAGTLPNPTDAELDGAVQFLWARMVFLIG